MRENPEVGLLEIDWCRREEQVCRHAIHVVAQEELEPSRQAIRAIDPENASIVRPLDDVLWARYASNRSSLSRRTFLRATWRSPPDACISRSTARINLVTMVSAAFFAILSLRRGSVLPY